MSVYDFSPNHIVGIDIFLERFQTRLYVGKLEKKENTFHFSYDHSYLKATHILSVGPEFPLTRQNFLSQELFPSFLDRLPDPDNPAYRDYCSAAGISTEINDPIVLLATIGKRGPSSFIFEPIYKDTFNFDECEKFREKIGITMQDFAYLFDISLSILQKIKAGESSGKEILKRLEIFMSDRNILYKQIKKNMGRLHTDKQRELMFHLLEENLILLNTPSLLFDKAKNIIEQTIDCRWYITSKNDQKIERKIKTFNIEKKPIFKIAEYLKLIGCSPQHITFCSQDEDLGCDGKFNWPNQEIRLEVTRAMDKEKSGKNEHLAREDAKTGQIIAPDRDYVGGGINHPSQLPKHIQTHISYRDPTNQDIHNIIRHLKVAFDHKNSKDKYKEMWLIMTLKLPWNIKDDFEFNQGSFYEICSEFWTNVDISLCKFNRVFIITENFIHDGQGLNKFHNSLQNVLWDSGILKPYYSSSGIKC